jgi:hypothetical protein
MITWWILSNLHNYLKKKQCLLQSVRNNFSTDAYVTSTSANTTVYKWIPFTKDEPMYIQFYQFLHCRPFLFILHKPHSMKHCLYGFVFLLILSRVLYICLTFSLTGDCCGRDRMVVLFPANNSLYPITNYFYIGNHWFHFNWQWDCHCSDRMVVEFSTSN